MIKFPNSGSVLDRVFSYRNVVLDRVLCTVSVAVLSLSPTAALGDNLRQLQEWHSARLDERIAVDRADLPTRKGLLLNDIQSRLTMDFRDKKDEHLQQTADEWCTTFSSCDPIVQGYFASSAIWQAGSMLHGRLHHWSSPVDEQQSNAQDVGKTIALQMIKTVIDAASNGRWLEDDKFSAQLLKISEDNSLPDELRANALLAAKKNNHAPNKEYDLKLSIGEKIILKETSSRSWVSFPLSCSKQAEDVVSRFYQIALKKNILEKEVHEEPSTYRVLSLDESVSRQLLQTLRALEKEYPKLSDAEKSFFCARTVRFIGALCGTNLATDADPFYMKLLDSIQLSWPQYNALSIAVLGNTTCFRQPGRIEKAIKNSEKALEIAKFGDPNIASEANWTTCLGELYVLNDNFVKAKECFEKSKQIYEFQMPDCLGDGRRDIDSLNCWLESLSSTDSACAPDLFVRRNSGGRK